MSGVIDMKLETLEAAARSRRASAPPQAGDDSIFLRGLLVDALIGVYEHERHAPQPILVDLELGLAHSCGCFSDRLVEAVDYGAVVATVRGHARLNRCELLEAFAQNLADTLLADFDLPKAQLASPVGPQPRPGPTHGAVPCVARTADTRRPVRICASHSP